MSLEQSCDLLSELNFHRVSEIQVWTRPLKVTGPAPLLLISLLHLCSHSFSQGLNTSSDKELTALPPKPIFSPLCGEDDSGCHLSGTEEVPALS